MTFTKFVEVGRVVLINYGPDLGKLATIVDIIDGKRVLIDGPQSATGVHRQVISLKRVALTEIVVSDLSRNATQKSLREAWESQDIQGKWKAGSWAKKIESKKKRAALTDFDRFEVMVLRQKKAKLLRGEKV